MSESIDPQCLFSELIPLLSDANFAYKFNNSLHSSFDPIRLTLSILSTLADYSQENSSESSLFLFKKSSSQLLTLIIPHLILRISQKNLEKTEKNEKNEKNDEISSQILAKWWINYLSLLQQAYLMKKSLQNWGDSKEIWFNEQDKSLLEASLLCLNEDLHWKMLLLRGILLKNLLLPKFIDKFGEICEEITNYQASQLEKEINAIKVLLHKNPIDKRTLFRNKTLCELRNSLEKPHQISLENSPFLEGILNGRFSKRIFNGLSHTVILGDDGGFYALLNTITEEEKLLLVETGEISNEYFQGFEIDNTTKLYKIVIGKGSFGTIRLSMALTRNESSSTLKAGQVICVKKTSYFAEEIRDRKGKVIRTITNEEIRDNCWNDYCVAEFSKLVFSPAVYDLRIVESSIMETNIVESNIADKKPEKHQKGYNMQQFIAVYDGAKAFAPTGRYYNNWTHQKSYLIDIFEVISKLLDKGICMTDLKPQNTLYDAENQRGMLIDLAGVVRRENREELKKIPFRNITEFTEKYSAPELMEAANDEEYDEEIDLCAAMAYTLGNIAVFTGKGPKEIQGDLRKLVMKMVTNDAEDRISVEKALEILRNIGKEEELVMDLSEFVKILLVKTEGNLEKFGLNPNLPKITKNFIDLKTSELDPERFIVKNLLDLKEEMEIFLYKEPENHEKVFVLLGSSGSGKSTLLHLKYLEALRRYKPGDSMPFFINLSAEDDLRARWKWLCEETGKYEENFTLFSGIRRYPVSLFIDSFDEIPSKINYIAKFLEDLGNNSKNKCVICCRSEFIQKEQELVKWFKPTEELFGFRKRYITPLNIAGFDDKHYIMKYYEDWETTIKIDDILKKIKEKNLKDLMKNGYMVHLTLEVLPEILAENCDITRLKIYEKYTRRNIVKVAEGYRSLIMEKYNICSLMGFGDFIEEVGESLAVILHRNSISKLNWEKSEEFFIRFLYNRNIAFLENHVLMGVIRALDLNLEVKGAIPNEKIIVGFAHDSLKNYFLVKRIIKEAEKGGYETLGTKSIVNDEVLIKFLAEVVIEQEKFEENFEEKIKGKNTEDKNEKIEEKNKGKNPENFQAKLKEIVMKSKENFEEFEEKKLIFASANAMTILIAANVSFSGEDLTGIKVNGANLRDGVFEDCDFTDANLSGSTLQNCKLNRVILDKTMITEVKLGLHCDINVNSAINSLCFSPDGTTILCGSNDHIVKLYDSLTKKLVKSFIGHKNIVNAVCFSKDGALILSGSADKTQLLWDKNTGEIIRRFDQNESSVDSLCFSPDDSQILSGFHNSTIKLYDISTGNLLRTFSHNKDAYYRITSLCFSADSSQILTASTDKTIILWEKSTGNIVKTFINHPGAVNSICFSSDGLSIAAGCFVIKNEKPSPLNSSIKIWDKNTGNLIKSFENSAHGVFSLCFSADNLMILAGYDDNSIALWEKATGVMLKKFEGHTSQVKAVAFAKNGYEIISGSVDNTIKTWDLSSGNSLKNFQGHKNSVISLDFSPNNDEFISTSADNTIKLWEEKRGLLIRSFEGHDNIVESACFSEDGGFILSGSRDNTMKLWEKSQGYVIKTYIGHKNSVFTVAFSKDSLVLLSGSADKTIKLWEKASGIILRSYEEHKNWVNSAIFSPDCEEILSGSYDKTINLWEKNTGKLIRKFEGHQGFVISVCFSADGAYILSGSRDKTIKLWEKKSGILIKTYEGHKNWVNSAIFSPDENMILSASGDFSIKLWEKSSGKVLNTLERHGDWVNCARFSKDGKNIISCSNDKSIIIWKKCEKFKNLQEIKGFSRDYSKFLSQNTENLLELWDIKEKKLIKAFKREDIDKVEEMKGFFEGNTVENSDFLCKLVISPNETELLCKEMVLLNSMGVSKALEDVICERGAVKFDSNSIN